MKKLPLLLVLFTLSLYSQDRNLVYEFIKGTPIKAYNLATNEVLVSKTLIAQRGWRFRYDQTVKDGILIQMMDWEEGEEPQEVESFRANYTNQIASLNAANVKTNQGTVDTSDNPYYLISIDTFKANTKEFKNPDPIFSFSAGVLTVPIKIRPRGSDKDENGETIRPFDFGGDINIGLTAGLRCRLDKSAKSFLIPTVGINITSVSIDENSITDGSVTSKTNAASLTPIVGLIFEYNEFQFMGAVGWDKLAGKTGENWIYQDLPWIGVGLGYKLFNSSNNKPKTNVGYKPKTKANDK